MLSRIACMPCAPKTASISQDLGSQLEAAAESARAQLASALATNEGAGSNRSSKSKISRQTLPGLQDLKGHWNGTFQAYGGGGGAANVDFKLFGQDWKWGEYGMDQVRFKCQHSSCWGRFKDVTFTAFGA